MKSNSIRGNKLNVTDSKKDQDKMRQDNVFCDEISDNRIIIEEVKSDMLKDEKR